MHGAKFLVGRRQIAWTSHYYGVDIDKLMEWPAKKIIDWYNEAVDIHNELNRVDG